MTEYEKSRQCSNHRLNILKRVVCSVTQSRHHHGLDGVHAVFRLVEDHGIGRFEDLVGDLHGVEFELNVDLLADRGLEVVKGRQAVHEEGMRLAGLLQHGGVDLIGFEQFDA